MTDPIVPGGAGLPDQQSGPPDSSPPPAVPDEPSPPAAAPADSGAGFGMPTGFGTPPAADPVAPSEPAWGAPSAPASPPPADTWGAPSAPAPGGAPAGGWAPGTPLTPSSRPRAASKVRSIIIIVVVLAVIVGAVAINLFGAKPVGDLKVGDCFDVPTLASESDTVEDVQHHPCDQSHTGEVIFVGDFTGGTSLYPGVSDFDTFVGNSCGPAFESYVGTSLDSDADLSIGYFYPLEDGWSNGDRSVTCYATRTDDAPMTKTVKGSGSGAPAGSSTP